MSIALHNDLSASSRGVESKVQINTNNETSTEETIPLY